MCCLTRRMTYINLKPYFLEIPRPGRYNPPHDHKHKQGPQCPARRGEGSWDGLDGLPPPFCMSDEWDLIYHTRTYTTAAIRS
jgi:hypothetical protein